MTAVAEAEHIHQSNVAARRGDKVVSTDTHVYFLTGPFSQWHPSAFDQRLTPDGDRHHFYCAEQYMMAGKAHLFGDQTMLDHILRLAPEGGEDFREYCREVKNLGRQVSGFDPEVWNENARTIVFRGNWAKFTQHQDLLTTLLATGDRKLVEGASYDAVWGVKLAWNDPAILDEANWKGTNWLGDVLTRLRDLLVEGDPMMITHRGEWLLAPWG